MPDDSRSIGQDEAQGSNEYSKKPGKIDWIAFGNLKFEPPSWLIDKVIPAKSLIMLYGTRGLGKTFVALDIAASIASGRPFLGRAVAQKGRIGYLLAERPEGLKRRLSGWLAHHKEEDPGVLNNVFAANSELVKIDEPRQFNQLVASIRDQLVAQRPGEFDAPLRLLVIDPLAAHMGGSENEATQMSGFTTALRELSKIFGCSILLVHHEGKNNFNNRLGARGSSALEAALDTILYMTPDQKRPHHAEIRMTKQRESEEEPSIWVEMRGAVGKVPRYQMERIELGKFPVLASPPDLVAGPSQKEVAQAAVRAEILTFVRDNAPHQSDRPGVTVKQIEEHLIVWRTKLPAASQRSVKQDAIRKHLGALTASGHVKLLSPPRTNPHRFGPAT